MTTIKCNKCGEEVAKQESTMYRIIIISYGSLQTFESYELCDKCGEAVNSAVISMISSDKQET